MLQQETERDTFINQITVGSKENILHLFIPGPLPQKCLVFLPAEDFCQSLLTTKLLCGCVDLLII
jgi:hypothetical protein